MWTHAVVNFITAQVALYHEFALPACTLSCLHNPASQRLPHFDVHDIQSTDHQQSR